MKIKKQYEMNDVVWIHIGDGKLHKGKVVDIFDLEHAGYSKDMEFYIVEIQTSIEPLLEVRTWENISQDQKGPIGAYRELKDFGTKRFLGKMGIELPTAKTEVLETPVVEHDEDPSDPTPEQVNAAIARAEQAQKAMYQSPISSQEKKKRNYAKAKPYLRKKPKTQIET